MRFPKITTLATFAAVAALALTGCSSGPAEAESTSTPQTSPSAPTSTEPAITKDHVAETTQNPDAVNHREVTVVKVLDLNHIEVTPAKATDTLFGETFTVAVSGYKAPAQGECGFAEATAFGEDFYVEGNDFLLNYVRFGGPLAQIQDGEHQGDLWLSEDEAVATAEAKNNAGIPTSAFDELQIKNPVVAGFALPDHDELVGMTYDQYLETAQKKQNGLHKLCPGYGQ